MQWKSFGPILELNCRRRCNMVTETALGNAESSEPFPSAALYSPRAAKKATRVRVLVVDDERLMRWSIAHVLGARGYEVTEAERGDAAIRALMGPATSPIDVVLLDLCLPDFCDLSLLTLMRQLSPATPVILMTAFGSPEIVEAARGLGAFTVIDKPFDINAVAPLILRAIQAHRAS